MVTPSVREQFLVLSVLGKDPMDLAHLLCRTSLESRCVMDMARLTRHGEYSALVLQVSGSWDALARMESAVTSLAKKHGLRINLTRSSPLDDRPMALPYVAYVSAVYRPDIVSELCQFFCQPPNRAGADELRHLFGPTNRRSDAQCHLNPHIAGRHPDQLVTGSVFRFCGCA